MPENRGEMAEIVSALDPLIHAPARLLIMSHLFAVERADYTWLLQMTRLTWGNLASHLAKLEQAGYVLIEKKYQGKKPLTMVRLTDRGWNAFREYRAALEQAVHALNG